MLLLVVSRLCIGDLTHTISLDDRRLGRLREYLSISHASRIKRAHFGRKPEDKEDKVCGL